MKNAITALCAAAFAFMVAPPASAAEIVDARIRLEPESPYVGQGFDVCLDIATEPGCELQDINVQGFPFKATLQQADSRERDKTADGRDIEWHRLRGRARATIPLDTEIRGAVRAMVAKRVQRGFFNSYVSSSSGKLLEPFRLLIREVPADGAPDGYAGAIGVFAVEAKLEPDHAAVGDLLALTVTAKGAGDLNGASPFPPSVAGSDLRVYPPQEIARTDDSVTLRQVVIPLSTNITAIGSATFPYFDAEEGAYRVAESPPIEVVVSEHAEAADAPAVKTIPAPVVQRPSDAGERAVSEVVATASDIRRVLPFAVAALLAVVAAGVARFRRGWARAVVALAVFAVALFAGKRIAGRGGDGAITLANAQELRIAPSASSKSQGWAQQGSEARMLETYGAWTRIGIAGGRSGWTVIASAEAGKANDGDVRE